MPVLIDGEERGAYLETNESPGPLLDLLATAAFRVADAALKLGVFAVLAEGELAATAVAERIDADARGTQILLEALEVYGYVVYDKGNGRYANSDMAARWMLPPEPGGYDYPLVHRFWSTILFQLWGNLEESVRQGRPPINFYQWLEEHPDTLKDFHAMLSSIAHLNASEMMAQLDGLSAPSRLLDLGGSHAIYTLAFCQRYPDLAATLVDLPGALAVGRANIAAAQMDDRITLQPGDFMAADWGQGYDVVLLFSIIHGLSPGENAHLLRRIADALTPQGVVIILEQLAGSGEQVMPPTSEAYLRIFKLNLFHLLGAQTYTLGDVTNWLEAANLAYQRRIILPTTQDSVIIAQKRA